MIRVHNNFESVRLSRHISHRIGSVRKSLARISSGMRITSAADDAAGSQISARLTSQLLQTQKELDGVNQEASLLQTLEGALSESEGALQRMREVALAAAGTALSTEDREALEREFKGLMTQLDEIAEGATFNGLPLLNGEARPLKLSLLSDEAGAGPVALNTALPKLNSEGLGRQSIAKSARRGVFLSPLESGDVTINGVSVRGTSWYDDALSYSYKAGSALAKAKAINAVSGFTGVRASVDRNVVRGQEAVRAIELDHDHWFALNGVRVSGFMIEAHDATKTLQKALNAHVTETGVKVSVDQEGQLVMVAEDGRNITLEYSDASVRDALRVVDTYGDPNNLGNTVDPAQFRQDGDVTSVTYTGTSFVGQFDVIGDHELLGVVTSDSSGGYLGNNDRADIVFEVVNPGTLGVATFRVKREVVASGTADGASEDYRFNGRGNISASDGARLRDSSSYYNDASTRVLRLKVLAPGSPDALLAEDRPLVEATFENLDEPSDVVSLGTFRLDNTTYTQLANDYGVSFQVHGSARSVGAVTRTNTAAGHDYFANPYISAWSGAHTTEFTVRVKSDGHALGSAAPTSPIAGAELEVTAYMPSINETVTKTITLDSSLSHYINLNTSGSASNAGGLYLTFPTSASRLTSGTTSAVWTNTSGYTFTPTIDNTYYLGDVPREYEVRFLSDGVFSSAVGDGPAARVSSYDISGGGRVLEGSYDISEVDLNALELLSGGVYEGLRFSMRGPRITAQREVVASHGNISFGVGSYAGENRTGVLRITAAGEASGSDAASYEFYYKDDPSVTVASGQLGATTLPNGLTMSAWSGFAPVVTLTPDDGSLPSNYLRLTSGSAYTEPTIGDVTATLQDQGGGVFDLKVDWSFEGGGSSTSTITNVQADTDLNLGYGLKARFDSAQLATNPLTDGASFTGRADPRNFEVGDLWEVDLQATVHAGDSFRVRAQPQDLVEDTTWQFTAYTSEWETGDEVTLTYNHNFEAPLQTLTDTLTYGGDLMEAIKITGTGRFETGDEIRVNTRSYLGGVSSSGYYTNNLYPTDYVLTVTKGGDLGQAEVTWVRTDGRTDTERGGVRTITGLQADTPIYLEEGVYVTFEDLGQTMYLAEGDQIRIPVGQKLEYTFGAQLSLQSRDNIELSYSDVAVDNLLGRVMFLGDEVQQDEQGWEELSLQKGMIGASEARSLKSSGLLSMSEVREALSTIDVALAQVSEAQTKVGAGLKRAEHRLASLNETAASLLLTKGRLEGADIAQETLSLAAEQIALMSAPMLSEVSLSSALTALDLVRQSER